MAVVPAPGPLLAPGTFALIARPPEWDEVMILGFVDPQTAVCKTTTPDGSDWAWVLVQLLGMHVRLPLTAADGTRRAPAGLAEPDVNWICTPPDGAGQWRPNVAEIGNATAEAGLLVQQHQAGNTGWVVNQSGTPGALVPIAAVGVGGPMGPVGAGAGALAVAAPAGGGLGVGPDPAASEDKSALNLKAMEAAIQQLDDAFSRAVQSVHAVSSSKNCMKEFKSSGAAKRVQGSGVSPQHVFPLPPLSKDSMMLGPPGSDDSADFRCLYYGGNLVVAALNWMHGAWMIPSDSVLSAAHGRVHTRIGGALQALVMTDEPTLSPMGLDHFTRHSQLYSGSGVVLALGVRGGVPPMAGDVPLAQHLEHHFPEMAQQVLFPQHLLLRSRKRPRRIKRGYTWLDSTYPMLVKKNLKAGLHTLKRGHQVAKHRGHKVLAGAFAVIKDEAEDRVITDPQVNQLLDGTKLPRPRFAYIPSLRCVTVPKSGAVVVTKRDARHYFHRLRIGRRWGKWLCGPPITASGGRHSGEKMYPAAQSAPMGFGPSAGWAQGLTDVVALDANLPQDKRLHPDFVVPESLPVWGSIIDDIWALDHVDTDATMLAGPDWLGRAELRGVEPNHRKSVDAHEGEEIQGYYVHPTEHWIGVALQKRRNLMQSTFMVLMQSTVMVGVVDRLIGKHGFVHSARVGLRSVFQATYPWIASVRSNRRQRVVIPDDVWVELCVSTLLLGFAEFNLSSPWSQRVECTDASMTGLGRAYGVMPTHVVQALARYSDHPAVYTNLHLPWGIGLKQPHACPLRKVRLPVEKVKWSEIGVAWQCEHITLGEADAICWASEDRLRRPGDDGCRFVHPLDSAACVGAFTKGRSSSVALNQRCRRQASIELAGGHQCFYPWVPSKENPADRPSRRFEPSSEREVSGSDLESEKPVVDLRGVSWFPPGTKFFIHFCSGPRRNGDLIHCVEMACAELGIHVHGLAIDPLAEVGLPGVITTRGDLLDPKWLGFLMDIIHEEIVLGGFGSPPCSTISAARHVAIRTPRNTWAHHPRPLRSRSSPWECLPNRSPREQHAVAVGSALFLIVLGLLGEVASQGGWVGLEHPADRGRPPFASFFATAETASLCRRFSLKYETAVLQTYCRVEALNQNFDKSIKCAKEAVVNYRDMKEKILRFHLRKTDPKDARGEAEALAYQAEAALSKLNTEENTLPTTEAQALADEATA
eukprot:Skav218186  [mRNA]  locus=scaffold5213:236505:243510:- [translate_table: standard]